MSDARALEPIKISDKIIAAENLGAKPELCLLSLSQLVVDETYQRKITARGKTTILRIYENFDWRKFSPCIVAKHDDGGYALIDGQHRATAALMLPGIDMVPCMVVQAGPEEAASIFAAINACVTGMTPGQIYMARVAAREPAALAVKAACDAAGVRVLPHRRGQQIYDVGDTLAIGTIEKCLKEYGHDTLVTALMCITESADGNAGCLRGGLIKALCIVLDANKEWRDLGAALFDALDEFNFEEIFERARLKASYSEGKTGDFVIADIRTYLKIKLDREQAA